ncbi:hypothetical protein [Sinomicrobium weinanense]|uniref:Lipoprotein n=1 Tax=Sinomicrobium weinanense TaxID=2842200 RepID=A0A926JVQ6_9FLAO|nr:hypothetical protein [Sinomicrobium weinanense]MBC9798452.1 hypothetical protein [Sinomicrobium weinanense]MBU3125821.1 hypothetical protein [Sinomicrobium weinanense]
MKKQPLYHYTFFVFSVLILFSCSDDNGKPDEGPDEPGNTITQAEFDATLGDHTRFSVDVSNQEVDPGPSGSGVSWDFSKFDNPFSSNFQEALNCPDTEGCDVFPEANRAFLLHGDIDSYSYFTLSKNEYLRIGGINDDIQTTMNDPETVWKFPIAYQQEFSDDYHETGSNGEITTATKDIEVDGYGTLTTAAGTFSNTLRVKMSYTVVVDYPDPLIPQTQTNLVQYIWLNKNYAGGLLLGVLFSETKVNGEAVGIGKGLYYTDPEPL